jgi:hypothetical protein
MNWLEDDNEHRRPEQHVEEGQNQPPAQIQRKHKGGNQREPLRSEGLLHDWSELTRESMAKTVMRPATGKFPPVEPHNGLGAERAKRILR